MEYSFYIYKITKKTKFSMLLAVVATSSLICAPVCAVDINGRWSMNANGHPAILVINGNFGTYEYINWYDCASGKMENLTVTDTTISWDRECYDTSKNQHHTGQISVTDQ